jgi:hypothetical protein
MERSQYIVYTFDSSYIVHSWTQNTICNASTFKNVMEILSYLFAYRFFYKQVLDVAL